LAQLAIHRTNVTLRLPRPVGLFISLVKAMLVAMTGNKSFPSPTPSLSTVSTAVSDLETAQAAALTRVKGAVDTRNAKKAALALLVDQLASYVQTIADGDAENAAAIIQSAGMGVRKALVRAPRIFSVKQGSVSGSVKVVAPSAGRRAAYDWQYSTDGGKTWIVGSVSTKASSSVTGLPAGATVAFRYRSTTPKAGESDWSQPLSFLVK
jgi:hypothetical protein